MAVVAAVNPARAVPRRGEMVIRVLATSRAPLQRVVFASTTVAPGCESTVTTTLTEPDLCTVFVVVVFPTLILTLHPGLALVTVTMYC